MICYWEIEKTWIWRVFFEVGSSDPLDGCDLSGPKRKFFGLFFLYWSTVIAEALIMWAKSTLYEYCICERVLAL